MRRPSATSPFSAAAPRPTVRPRNMAPTVPPAGHWTPRLRAAIAINQIGQSRKSTTPELANPPPSGWQIHHQAAGKSTTKL